MCTFKAMDNQIGEQWLSVSVDKKDLNLSPYNKST